MPFAAHGQALTCGREQLRTARVVRLETPRPTVLDAVMENGGRRIVVDLAVEAGAPNRISGLGLAPQGGRAPRAQGAHGRAGARGGGQHGEARRAILRVLRVCA